MWTDSGEPVTIPGRKVRALLADLLVHEGRPVSTERLVEDLWGEGAPADPAAAVHVRVSQLRRALANAEPGGRDLVMSQAPGYALRAEPDAMDAAKFATLVGQAQAVGNPQTRAGLLAEALDLWRGAALADFADEEFTQADVARWEEQRLAAVEAYAEARLDLGEHRELVGELGEHVARHPYRERLRAAHMRALYRAGRASEALDSFQELRRRLADELGLDPGPELAALQQAILTNDPAEHAPVPRSHGGPAKPVTNLPAPVAELIGRDHTVERVRELLGNGRLVTLTGPGGVGKTSVAVAVARTQVEVYLDGAWLVDLTAWDGSGDPADLILSLLSISDGQEGQAPADQRLASVLRERQVLMVLDNCEHVVEQVAGLVGTLLPAAPGLRVLATSREPLRLRGELRLDVPPLEISETDDPARLAQSPAVRLFLARAGLEPTAEITKHAAEVCRRLDGIPLALELAATRAPVLGVSELAARLSVPKDRFGLLGAGARDAPARQQTLAGVIDWSWRLLADAERIVLRRLAVHSGGCTLAAAEAVCAGDGVSANDVLGLMAGLVDRSLVVRGDGPRFRLLESVSAYCLDQLREAGEETALRRRHADHYLAQAEQGEPSLRESGQREWLHRLDAETANVRTAMDTYRRADAADPALRMAMALVWYWFLRGRLTEARRALTEALAVPGNAAPELRAAAEVWRTGLAILQGQAGPGRVAEVLHACGEIADPTTRARAEWFLAMATIHFGDEEATGELLEGTLDTFRTVGDRWGEAAALSTRAMLAHMRGDLAALETDARRSAEIFAEFGDEWGVLQATDWLIGLADLTGDHAQAAKLARDGLQLAEDLGLWSDVAGRLSWLAWLAVQVEDYPAARDYAEQAKRLAADQGQRSGEVFATLGLAFAARRDGKLDVAEEHLKWLLASAREQQTDEAYPPFLSMVLVELGLLAGQRGDPDAALARHLEGMTVYQDQDSAHGMAWALAGMAAALVLDGRSGLGAQLLGAADTAWQKVGQPLSPSERTELALITATVRRAEPGFEALFARGAELTPEQARSLLGSDRA